MFQIIRGIGFPAVPWFTKKNIEDTMDYVPHDGDIIVASFPKTGTTWLQYIVTQIVSKAESFPSFEDNIEEAFPFIEVTGTSAIEKMKSPRMYKHHCPYNMVRKNEKAKYLYNYRNPEDTLVSNYHFVRGLAKDAVEFDGFFENFISDKAAYGGYFNHVLSFLDHKDDENLLLVSYESLQQDRKAEILRIAKFLGEDHFQNLVRDESLLGKIVEHTSFDYMKKRLTFSHKGFQAASGSAAAGKVDVNFFRKGVVGDGKSTLSPDQLRRLRQVVEKTMKNTEVKDEWLK